MVCAIAIVWLLRACGETNSSAASRVHRREPVFDTGRGGVCLLDVPVNKTSIAFTKPVDRVVGDAVHAWERERPTQPAAPDEKTGELVHFLFPSDACASRRTM